MSLLSLTRRSCWTKASPFATTATTSTSTSTTNNTTTAIRTYWREVLRQAPNPKNPTQIKFEDPSIMAMRSSRAQNAEGLLRRKAKFYYYEKPWMERKKLKMVRKYRSMERGVNDLKSYVKFIQDAKDVLEK